MKKYLYIIYTNLKKRAVYKADILLGYLFSIVIALTAKYFWLNLASYGKIPQSELPDYISYSAMTAIIGILFGGEIIGSFSERIKNGSVISDLQKPLSFQLYTISGSLGNVLGDILFTMLPKFIAMVLIIGIYIPANPLNVLIFGVSFLLGCMIIIAFDFILSLFAIYLVEVMSLIILKSVVIGLFAGAALPLWIFPEKLLQVLNLLPFRYICYLPITIYLEKLSVMEALSSVLVQVVWVMVLLAIGKVLSHYLLKRITVAGG